jgi:hypothetical protein
MSLPRNLTPEVLTTSNTLLQVYLLAVQFEDAQNEITSVSGDRNIAQARADTLQANWGTLLEVAFDSSFTVDQYKRILLGLIQARIKAPTRRAIRDTVAAFAPTANIVIRDYYNDSVNFIGPNPSTFFTNNGTGAGNVWNGINTFWTPGTLLQELGFDQFGTQVQVVSVGDAADIPYLHFVPAALEFIRPAHQFLALTFQQEIVGP